MDEPDLETLIRRHRRWERGRTVRSVDRRPLDPTMDEFVSQQSDGQPMTITLRRDLPSGTSVTTWIHNDAKRLDELLAQGWIETADD
jgi:hypothetical protein